MLMWALVVAQFIVIVVLLMHISTQNNIIHRQNIMLKRVKKWGVNQGIL